MDKVGNYCENVDMTQRSWGKLMENCKMLGRREEIGDSKVLLGPLGQWGKEPHCTEPQEMDGLRVEMTNEMLQNEMR